MTQPQHKTAEIKVLVEPELKAQVNQARGSVPMSAWVREAIQMRLRNDEMTRAYLEKTYPEIEEFRKAYNSIVPTLSTCKQVVKPPRREVEALDLHELER